MRCVCRFTQLAISYASAECKPRNLEYILAKTHNLAAKSSVRQYQYNELYKAINDGSPQPYKIVSDCKTRWLSIQPAEQNIIAQWLKSHGPFKIVINAVLMNCYLRCIQKKKNLHFYVFATNCGRCTENYYYYIYICILYNNRAMTR